MHTNNRSVGLDTKASTTGCFQFLDTKNVPAGPAHGRKGSILAPKWKHIRPRRPKWKHMRLQWISDQGLEAAV